MSRVDGLSFRSNPAFLQRHTQVQTNTYPFTGKRGKIIKGRIQKKREICSQSKSLFLETIGGVFRLKCLSVLFPDYKGMIQKKIGNI